MTANVARSHSHRRRVLVPAAFWWRASGQIPAANCLEHVTTPAQAQAYAGSSVTAGQPWTVAVTLTWSTSTRFVYYFSAATGNLYLGRYNKYDRNQLYTTALGAGGTLSAGMANATTYVLFVISDGTNVTGYKDNVAGTPIADGIGIAGTARWRARHDGACLLPEAVTKGAVYNIALSAAQRTALYSAMSP